VVGIHVRDLGQLRRQVARTRCQVVSIPIDHFKVLEVEEMRALHQDLRSHEVRNFEIGKKFYWKPVFC
jgi:hypothetical protein